ncbi:MAG: hypothetical protein R3B67_01575 [Phycisphaerales bacterium]
MDCVARGAIAAIEPVPIQCKDDHISTLMYASRYNYYQRSSPYDAGASVDLVDRDGNTALIFAAAIPHETPLKLRILLDAGATIDSEQHGKRA